MKKFLPLLLLLFLVKSALAETFYTLEDFKNIFLKEIKNKLSWIQGDLYLEKIEIEPDNPQILKETPYKIYFLSGPRVGSNVGIFEFGKDHYKEKIKIWGYVEAKVPVLILKNPVVNKAVLNEEDLIIEFKSFSRLPPDVILDKKLAVGKQVRMSLKPGTILRYSHIERPVIIKRNQIVGIIAKGENFIVKAKGIALQEGKEGIKIKVKNLSSQKIIWGKVISSEEVEVNL